MDADQDEPPRDRRVVIVGKSYSSHLQYPVATAMALAEDTAELEYLHGSRTVVLGGQIEAGPATANRPECSH